MLVVVSTCATVLELYVEATPTNYASTVASFPGVNTFYTSSFWS